MPILSDMKGGTQMDGTEEKIIEFTAGSVPVAVAAKVYHKDATWVRAGIIKGWLPIGIATRDGKIVTEYCDVDVYALVDGNYYVDKSDFSYGDSIIKTDSNERYTVTSVGVLKGVYTVNKGYAVFRRIEIIEQNQEYAIVQTGVSYGLSAYDHIVLDGTRVEENQIIY